MIQIYKTGTFEAAHQLKGHPKCGKLHGHTYKYEVWISAQELTKPYNFVLDFHEIKEYFDKFDHSDLIIRISCEELVKNAVFYFMDLVKEPSSVRIRIWETKTAYAEASSLHFIGR